MQRDEEVWRLANRLANKIVKRERLQIGATAVAAIVINRYGGDLEVSKQALLLGAAGIAIYIILFELPGWAQDKWQRLNEDWRALPRVEKWKLVIWSPIFIFIFLLFVFAGYRPRP
jgi:hypothetical protein